MRHAVRVSLYKYIATAGDCQLCFYGQNPWPAYTSQPFSIFVLLLLQLCQCLKGMSCHWTVPAAATNIVAAYHSNLPIKPERCCCALNLCNAGKCAAVAGVKKVVVAPYFLSKGRHIQVGNGFLPWPVCMLNNPASCIYMPIRQGLCMSCNPDTAGTALLCAA